MENNKNKVAFFTLGCKTNLYETNGMIQKFKDAGYEIVEFSNKADIYVVNTCTVTSISDKKSRQFLRQAKKNNPDGIVVAVGCYVQVSKDDVKKIPEIDLCLGTNEKSRIVNYVEEYLENRHNLIEKNEKDEDKNDENKEYENEKDKNKNDVGKIDENKIDVDDVFKIEEFSDFGTVTYTEKTRAVIKIQDGCDRFCSYCIIPYARGKVRSRNPESIIKEISQIVKNGFKEVVLTGIHIASYGKDFKKNYELIDLLEEINKIKDLQRVRLRFNRAFVDK